MRRRRAWGSIQQRGNSLRITYPGCPGGETLPRGSTVKDAEALLARRKREVETGTWIEPDAMDAGTFLTEWLLVRDREGLVAGTLRHYRTCIARLQPLIGSVPMQKVTRAHAEAARDALRQSGLSPKAVNHTLDAARAAYGWALDHELVGKNPFAAVKRLTVPRHEAHPLDLDQARAYLAVCARPEEAPYGGMLAVALLTLRRCKSEWGAVRWRDVDLEARTARIVSIMQEDGTIRPAGSNKVKAATIRLPAEAVPYLRAQWSWQRRKLGVIQPDGTVDMERARAQADWLVWTNLWGEHVAFTSLYEAHKRILRLAGLPKEVRIHDLRHTGVSLHIALGTRAKEIQELCGHSTIAMTLDQYGHLFPADLETTVNRLGDALRRDAI